MTSNTKASSPLSKSEGEIVKNRQKERMTMKTTRRDISKSKGCIQRDSE